MTVEMWIAGKAELRVRSFEILGEKPTTKISVKSGHRGSQFQGNSEVRLI